MAAKNEVSAPVVAEKNIEGYTTLTAPSGAKTSVPDSIKDVLIESGYKK